MAVKIIKYLPKPTSAGTEYREVSEEDYTFIVNECIKILSTMAELDQMRDEDSRWVREQWWHKRSDKLHKGRLGQNTPCSVIGGLIHNIMFKEPRQRDLTAKQMEDLEYISNILSNVYDNITAQRFQIGLG